jgi:hypothetical protein
MRLRKSGQIFSPGRPLQPPIRLRPNRPLLHRLPLLQRVPRIAGERPMDQADIICARTILNITTTRKNTTITTPGKEGTIIVDFSKSMVRIMDLLRNGILIHLEAIIGRITIPARINFIC